MSTANKAIGGSAAWNLDQVTTGQPKGTTIPPNGVTAIQNAVDGTVNDSPKSPEVLLDGAELVYNSADRVSGVSWANSGTLVGNDLTYVDEPLQEDHISFPGTAGNYLSVPDSAALDLNGNTELEIVARVAADWHSEARRQVIVGKKGAGAASWELAIKGEANGTYSGCLILKINGVSDTLGACPWPVPAISDETLWIKATWSNATGKTRYYIAPDAAAEPTDWMEIGTTYASNQSLTGTIAANTENVYIGGDPNVGAASMLDGRIYYLAVRSSIGGVEVLEIDVPTDCAATTPDVDASFTATSGQTVTFHTSGTAPATCRLHNTLDVTLTHPWYEVTIPTALVPSDPYDTLMVWIHLNMGTTLTQKSQIPIVSVMGATPHATPTTYHPGWGIWYSNQTNKVGTHLASYFGITGSTITSGWTTALGTSGERVVSDWIDRNTPQVGYIGHQVTARSSSGSYNGQSAYWASLGSSVLTTNKFRILAYETNPFDILEVGLRMVNDNKPAQIGVPSLLVLSNASENIARAVLDLEPTWYLGEGFYVTADGTPTWLGETVSEGDWVYSTSANGTLESAVVWDVVPGSGLVWTTGSEYPMNLGDDLFLDIDDNWFFWVVLSAHTGNTTYANILEGFHPTNNGYVNLGVVLDADPADEIYMEVDGIDDYQWGDFMGNGYPGASYETPIIVSGFLERNPVDGDRLYAYASFFDDWQECLENPTAPLGTIEISSPLMKLRQNKNFAIWGFGMDFGPNVTRPTADRMDTIRDLVKRRSESY